MLTHPVSCIAGLLIAMAPGCATHELDEAAVPTGPCQQTSTSYERREYRIADVVLVIDRSQAAADYRDALERNLREFGAHLEARGDNMPDMHIGVVAADADRYTTVPQLDGCDAVAEDYLIESREPWFRCSEDLYARCPVRNIDAPLGDALACAAALPPVEGAERRALHAAVTALDNAASTGFRRPDADALFVVIIAAGDDQSVGAVDDYAARLAVHAATSEELFVSIIAPPDTVRLKRFAAAFLNAGVFSIDDESWVRAIALLGSGDILPLSCLSAERRPRDIDPANPGLQPDCTAQKTNEHYDVVDSAPVIPACDMLTEWRPDPDTPFPCWWIEPEPRLDCAAIPHTEGIRRARWQCECDPR